jgi:beta-ketoacyl-acyl-carrier-protein synthase II
MENHTTPRVVITGMGVVTPLGLNLETTWQRLLKAESGIGPLTRIDPTNYHVKIAAQINDFNPEAYPEVMEKKEAKRFDRGMQFALVAASEALKQADLKITEDNADEVGVLIGSGIGGLTTIQEGFETLTNKGPMRVSPFTAAMMLPNMPAGQVAITFGARGINYCLISACATGSHAIGEGFEIIRRGDAQAMIVGGTEAPICTVGLAAFHRTGAMSQQSAEPSKASRPFDAKRDGFVMSEGAGILILENLAFAQQRGARIIAEVIGYGATDDAYHVSAPVEGGGGAIKSMQRALKKAKIEPKDVDYINAHGTSTPLNDKSETQAIKKVFGEKAYDTPISSTKSMVGHMLGAAGAVEAIMAAQTIQTGIIHPTANYEFPDPECDLNYVPNTPIQKEVKVALKNSFGFGGHNATIILKKFEG